jgi:rubrerythrin
MTKTVDDLKAAFAGESQANRRYLAFAKQAEADGFPQVARLFKAVAEAETVHAHNHLKVLDEVKATAENLKAAIAGEHYEVTEMYPVFIEDSQSEEVSKATRSFKWAMEVEKVHETLYTEALAALGQSTEEYDYYVCPVCGHTHARNAPDKCPVCGTDGSRFMRVQ